LPALPDNVPTLANRRHPRRFAFLEDTAASPPCRETLAVKPLPVPPAPITAAPIRRVESPTPIAAAPVSPAATPIPAIISPAPATPVLSLLGRDAVEVLRLLSAASVTPSGAELDRGTAQVLVSPRWKRDRPRRRARRTVRVRMYVYPYPFLRLRLPRAHCSSALIIRNEATPAHSNAAFGAASR
jgi:hypothetical protein